MYCGMHGFFDVIVGALLGILITSVRVMLGPALDSWLISGDWTRPAIAVVILGLAVRFHPEPADNCPCFDDSVAFLGVVMGISIGTWNYADLIFGPTHDDPRISNMYRTSNSDVSKVAARLVGGIIVVFIWRAVMKPLLLRTLPPIFRFVGYYGLRIPRRFFLQSRDYNTVPTLRKDDKVLPRASEIPGMLSTITRRKRTISVGPQSEADAREFIANRDQMRKDERSASGRTTMSTSPRAMNAENAVLMTPDEPSDASSYLAVKGTSATPALHVTGPNGVLTPPASDRSVSSDSGKEDETSDRRLLSMVEKPRVRYDVEVITKLIVYAGIAWLAAEGNLLLFEQFGVL
jgi:hypothetical protein